MPKLSQKETKPIPPPTHIAQCYDDIIQPRIPGRPALDPFRFNDPLPTLRRDPQVLELLVPLETIMAEIEELTPPPDEHVKFKIINDEIDEFSRLVKSFSDTMLVESDESGEDALPFYLNTAQQRQHRNAIRLRAETHVDNKRKWQQRSIKSAPPPKLSKNNSTLTRRQPRDAALGNKLLNKLHSHYAAQAGNLNSIIE